MQGDATRGTEEQIYKILDKQTTETIQHLPAQGKILAGKDGPSGWFGAQKHLEKS